MDIPKISLRISETLSGLVLGGMFWGVEWLVFSLVRFLETSVFLWLVHFLNGLFTLCTLLLAAYSCYRRIIYKGRMPANPDKPRRSALPNAVFLLCIILVSWYFWF